MIKKLAAAAAAIVLGMSSLVGTTTGCDLSVENPGIVGDSTQEQDEPGGTSVLAPDDGP